MLKWQQKEKLAYTLSKVCLWAFHAVGFNSNWIIFASLGIQVSSFVNSIENVHRPKVFLNHMFIYEFHSNKMNQHGSYGS